MDYLTEIDDILDELTMIKRALNNQAYVTNKALEKLEELEKKNLGLGTTQQPSAVANYSHPHLEVFERLTDDANRVRKCVSHVS